MLDVVVIGGGHNGLVCAYYLAKKGLKVKILERRGIIGGAAVTEEFHPGFRNSTASYTVSLLNPKVIDEMGLYRHGLKILNRPTSNFLPINDRESLQLGSTLEEAQQEFARFSTADAEALPAYYDMLEQVADFLRGMLLETPIEYGAGFANIMRGFRMAGSLNKIKASGRRDVIDLFTKSAAEVLDQWFENDHVKAIFAFDSVVGNYASPYTPGSAYVLLHHVFGEVNGISGAWGHAVGGMGSITQAMAAAVTELGVEIQTSAGVDEVLVEQGSAKGVRLSGGEIVEAKRVVSNTNPKLLFQQLVAREHLPAEFKRRIDGYRCGSATFRMNVALSELPDFKCKPGTTMQPHHQSGVVMSPTMDYMHQAYLDAKADGWSARPIVEMLIPSTVDDSLAPPGMHVASLFCQHFAPELHDGRSWDDFREEAADCIIDLVSEFAPNFKAAVIGRKILSPLDLERDFGLIGGDIMHGSLGLDQLYTNRPIHGYSDYRTPIKGLYLCGSGTHPGGGVTGAPGHNAANEIWRDAKSWWQR
ncbi:MAG: NAD(P)/FAD-dependent oxidoreductase [Pseudomonadales bacterium]|jgi:phytoene dehydrogenase-like protein